ncbi:hypothetical protein SD10_08080 [Spirosoma radiotolerans]|uniref:Urease accessory protein UreJ n=1 Tax=Spirosoma radiotolerans TaxID=1379870 RepID=A0A0E4A0Z7_9BACT|nr:hypothetical protein SD10_08080 [Spirosoma radiotolerans]
MIQSFLLFVMVSAPCWGHGFGGNGLLHPLTGPDHVLAMLAVGIWSAQVGGLALYMVPGCFLGMMVVGGLVGLCQLVEQSSELMIALSVLVVGGAILLDRRISGWITSVGVGSFGFSHGLAHGLEMNQTVTPITYMIGFLITTLGLHLIGAVGALLLLEDKHGRRYIQLLGAGIGLLGVWLLLK